MSTIIRKRPIVAPVTEIIKTKNNYTLGKIYKITSPNCDEVYVGSTTKKLNDRFSCHISILQTKKVSSHIVIDKGDAVIELIEEFPCKSRKELERREGEIMKTILNCCNKRIAGRTCCQYYIDNCVIISKRRKEYRIDNLDKMRERGRQYYSKKKN